MRLFMKSYIPFSESPHVHTQQHCSISTLTHQLAFQSQQFLHHRTLNEIESSFVNSTIHHANRSVVQPNPVTRLSDCWKEYMGLRNWEGFLDPLDKKLAHEILRYGNFIEATYRGFDFDSRSPTYGSCKFNKQSLLEDCGVLGGGYKVTQYLRATSGIQVHEWVRSSWVAMQTSWIGYVAVSNDKVVIDRLGRREVVIALRGTATCLEWLENLRATLAPIPGSKSSNNNNAGSWNKDGPPMVESGFLSLYTSRIDIWPSLQDAIRMEVSQILEIYKDEPLSITITGHSLGAALATLAAHDIKTTFDRGLLVTVISFGGPRVGNQSFRSLIDKQGIKILRVVNPSDLITKVPGFVTDNKEEFIQNNMKFTTKIHHCNNKHNHKNKICLINNRSCNSSISSSNIFCSMMETNPLLSRYLPSWIQPRQRKDNHWWVYAEVGHELRLESERTEQLPYNLDNMNVAKCHDLKTYLNLVEGCPLKALIKRSLKKLTYRCNDKNKGSALVV